MGSQAGEAWKAELEKVWRDLGVPHFLAEIGVDFEEKFLTPLRESRALTNPYAGHSWQFFPLERLLPGVLHAAPLQSVAKSKGTETEPALWEEWFIEGTENHHHAMRNSLKLPADAPENVELLHWRSPENDVEHPETVMDVDWHYFNDADQRPYLLR